MKDSGSAEKTKRQFHTLKDYEVWVSQRWLHPRGSEEAQLHTRKKLEEELEELKNALEEDDRANIRLELGDLLWTATATSINAGYGLEDVFRQAAVSQHFDGEGPITIDEIDRLSDEFYGKEDLDAYWPQLNYAAFRLGKTAKIMYKMRPGIEAEDGKDTFMAAFINHFYGGDVVENLVFVTMMTSAIAQSRLGISLADVMQDNFDKLSDRISKGLPVTSRPNPLGVRPGDHRH